MGMGSILGKIWGQSYKGAGGDRHGQFLKELLQTFLRGYTGLRAPAKKIRVLETLIYARQHAFLLQAACDCWLRRAVVSLSGTCLAILYEE